MCIRMFDAAVLASMVIFCASTANAADARRYDRKLAEAAAEIVAARMGPLRGGFSVDEQPALLTLPPPAAVARPVKTRPSAPRPGEWHDGLAIAVEKTSTVSPEL